MVFGIVRQTSILLGAIVLGTLLPNVAFAQQPMIPMPRSSGSTPPPSQGPSIQRSTLRQQLNLTEQQMKLIQEIRTARAQQIGQVLTPAQNEKLGQELKAGKGLGEAFRGLDLNQDQRQKITEIMEKSDLAVVNLLTPQQRQKLETTLKQR